MPLRLSCIVLLHADYCCCVYDGDDSQFEMVTVMTLMVKISPVYKVASMHFSTF